MAKIIWVGSRLSDIQGSEDMFHGAITLFGSGIVRTPSVSFQSQAGTRVNQNSFSRNSSINYFYSSNIIKLINEICDVKFICYGTEHGKVDASYLSYFPFSNNSNIIRILQDKFRTRSMVSSFSPTAGCVYLLKSDCTEEKVKSMFPKHDRFVIQSPFGAGGEGTMLAGDGAGWKVETLPGHEVIVSPYIDGIPVNTHVLIGDYNFTVFRPSIQIISRDNRGRLLYRGGDFHAALDMDGNIVEDIQAISSKICLRLQKMGYKGVAGIDFIINKSGIFFVEINPRFQASSYIVNRAMLSNCGITLHQAHIDAFNGKLVPECDSFEIKESFITSTYPESFYEVSKSYSNEIATYDHFNFNEVASYEDGAVMERLTFSSKIFEVVGGFSTITSATGAAFLHDFRHWR